MFISKHIQVFLLLFKYFCAINNFFYFSPSQTRAFGETEIGVTLIECKIIYSVISTFFWPCYDRWLGRATHQILAFTVFLHQKRTDSDHFNLIIAKSSNIYWIYKVFNSFLINCFAPKTYLCIAVPRRAEVEMMRRRSEEERPSRITQTKAKRKTFIYDFSPYLISYLIYFLLRKQTSELQSERDRHFFSENRNDCSAQEKKVISRFLRLSRN